MSINSKTLRAIDELRKGRKVCFACGESANGRTGEHVFPRWLQNRYDLSSKLLSLRNGTTIPFKSIRVPACYHCNTSHFSRLENIVKKAMDEGWSEDRRHWLVVWAAKIYIGLFWKHVLLHDFCSPDTSRTIIPSSDAGWFKVTHLLMNSGRDEAFFNTWHGDLPYSLFIYDIAEDPRFGNFDCSVSFAGISIALRTGSLGIFASFDGGLYSHKYPGGPFNVAGLKLHPIQFQEVVARAHYKSSKRAAQHLLGIREFGDAAEWHFNRVISVGEWLTSSQTDFYESDLALLQQLLERRFGIPFVEPPEPGGPLGTWVLGKEREVAKIDDCDLDAILAWRQTARNGKEVVGQVF